MEAVVLSLAPGEDGTKGIVETRAAGVLQRMRRDILGCALPPGARLPFEFLRSTYKVSFSTLREALTRLAARRASVQELILSVPVDPPMLQTDATLRR